MQRVLFARDAVLSNIRSALANVAWTQSTFFVGFSCIAESFAIGPGRLQTFNHCTIRNDGDENKPRRPDYSSTFQYHVLKACGLSRGDPLRVTIGGPLPDAEVMAMGKRLRSRPRGPSCNMTL